MSRTRAEEFDDLVLDAVGRLARRWSSQLAEVEFVVEPVPPAGLLTPDGRSGESDVLDDAGVPLAQTLPVRPSARCGSPRIVLYRRPLRARAAGGEELRDLVHAVVVERVAGLLGLDPDDVDPDRGRS